MDKEIIKNIDWNKNIEFGLKHILEFYETIDWTVLSRYLPEHVLDKLANLSHPLLKEKDPFPLDWTIISKRKLSKYFILNNFKYLNGYFICIYQYLDTDFIIKLYNLIPEKIHWDNLCYFQNIEENLIKRFPENFNWRFVSMYVRLSENFILEHKDKLILDYILKYQNLSEEFKKKINFI